MCSSGTVPPVPLDAAWDKGMGGTQGLRVYLGDTRDSLGWSTHIPIGIRDGRDTDHEELSPLRQGTSLGQVHLNPF